MARRRVGVTLLIDPPIADEIDGLRRALGDRSLGRIAPHVTLVPPVNVRDNDLGDVLGLIRGAAASVPGALTLELGPPSSFLPDNPVLFLTVGGPGLERLAAIRSIVFSGPLWRSLSWPWVPHVTLADDADPAVVTAAMEILGGFAVTVSCARLSLLEERHGASGRRWEPLCDAALGPRRVVGRGGLEIELTTSSVVDPEGAELLSAVMGDPEISSTSDADRPRADANDSSLPSPLLAALGQTTLPLVVTARREGAVAGLAVAWRERGSQLLGVAVRPSARHQGIGTHLLSRVTSLLVEGGWQPANFERVDRSSASRSD